MKKSAAGVPLAFFSIFDQFYVVDFFTSYGWN